MAPRTDAQKKKQRILIFVGLSLLVHFAFIVALYNTQLKSDLKIPENTVFIDLDPKTLPEQQIAEKEKQRQVVESETANLEKPKDAKFLGERDQTVEEETRAKAVDSFRKGGNPAKASKGGKPALALKDLAPPTRNEFTPPTKAEIDGFREMQRQKMARRQNSPAGADSPENQGSATNDYLKNVKDGDKTLLNTKEFVYFSYYRRIRERLEVAWNSKLRSTLDSYVYGQRRLAGDKNYVTGLTVILDRNGKITAVKVRQRSGARDLDTAAVDAFNDAGPFPDPPAGLVDQNGQIQIPWDFILQS
jgi:TonB family protein